MKIILIPFTKLPEGFLVDEIKYHPTEKTWLLGYDRMRRDLWVSTDFAVTWTKISSDVTPGHFFWFEEKSDKNDYLDSGLGISYLLNILMNVSKIRTILAK